jgi:ribosomal protein L7/L12
MSQSRATIRSDGQEWEQVLAQLRDEGFTVIESIKVTRAVLRVTLGEAKQIVHRSAAWADRRQGFEQLHDVVSDAVDNLSTP